MPGELPDALQLRDVKYSPKSTDAQRVATAEAFLAAGRLAEALDLLLLARDEAGVARLRRRAVEEGRPILLLALRRDGRPVAREEWRRAGDAAAGAGRWREAFRAYTEAGDEEALARASAVLPGYELWQPQGK